MTQRLGLPSRRRDRRQRAPLEPGQGPTGPFDGEATEIVRVIQFLLPAGDAIQPVILVERDLLH